MLPFEGAAVNAKGEKSNAIQWRIALAALLTSPIVYIFVRFGHENRGWAAWVFLMMVGFTVGAHWKWRRQVMFWIGAVILVTLHIALLIRVPWDSWNLHGKWPSLLGLVDFPCNVAVMQLMLLPAKRREHRLVGTTSSAALRPPQKFPRVRSQPPPMDASARAIGARPGRCDSAQLAPTPRRSCSIDRRAIPPVRRERYTRRA